MSSRATTWLAPLAALLSILAAGCASAPVGTQRPPASPSEHRSLLSIRKALTFHASLDQGTDADFAAGDPWMYQAPGLERRRETRPGLPSDGSVRIDPGAGRHGGALHFTKRSDAVVFYRAAGNVPWHGSPWSGAISFWLRADTNALAMGFCDPLHVTPRGWDDAAFFVEFERRTNDVPFRLGAYADRKVWNPQNRPWGEMSAAEKPVLVAPTPAFEANRWTHVAFSWENFNTGRGDGFVRLWLDGVDAGRISERTQTFTWNPADTRLLLGIGYIGWIDDVAVFNRALADAEIRRIRELPRGVRSLYAP